MQQGKPRMIQGFLQRNPLSGIGFQEHLNELLRLRADLLPHIVIQGVLALHGQDCYTFGIGRMESIFPPQSMDKVRVAGTGSTLCSRLRKCRSGRTASRLAESREPCSPACQRGHLQI